MVWAQIGRWHPLITPFFSHDAAVTFGNGVSHGYDDEFGHGILDIYANALNPIRIFRLYKWFILVIFYQIVGE